jgi:membrane-bound serine protease (ClpP class)
MKGWLPLLAAIVSTGAAGAPERVAGVIRIEGAIGPPTAGYIARATQVAAARDAECLIVELDTPGGLLDSTKDIVKTLYESPRPVVVFVTPSGATATSAGCFIALAADFAAMAPNTSIGAAHPVEIGGLGAEKADDVMTKKVENYAVSYIEAIADRRHRNADWAKSAVRDSASITAEKALELKVIDLVARDAADLLRQLDGRRAGDRVLHTAGAKIEAIPMIAREKVFQAIWRPEVMFVLMLVAIYGIIGELSNPGVILPGVAGGIALVLALYMSAILPVNIAGLVLLLLSVALFVADVFATTHGVLTVGGVVAFFLGSLLLFEDSGPAFRLPLSLIVPATVITTAFFVFVIGAGLRAQRLPVRAGRETMLGQVVPALTAIAADRGRIFVEGEYWNARSDVPVEQGALVEIVRIERLVVRVRPKTQEAL